MRHDTPVGYWPVRLLPLLAAALGVSGMLVARGPMAIVAGLLLVAAAALELVGWGNWVRARSRALGMATLAGAAVCALLLAVAGSGNNTGDASSIVAQR
jgi:hypothetical protein